MLFTVSQLTEKLGLSSQESQTALTALTAPTAPIVLTAPTAPLAAPLTSRSLSPVIRRRNRDRKLSPMSKSFKKTLHVSHISL